MSEYWSGSITFTGLGSGTDFDSIIEATMEVESYRLTRMEAWEEQWTAKLEQVQEISSELSVYKTQLETMDTMSEFLVKSASATDSSVLSVSADSDAIEATHTIEVGHKAQNDIWSSTSGWDSEDTVITDTEASFAVEINGEVLELEVSAGTTLEGFVNLINNSTEMGSDIRANLIDDGDEQHLQIRSLDLGEDYAITIQDLGEDGITGLTPDDFEQTQVAQNAKIKVDGYPSGDDEWIERDSNTFSDVIDGLTFTILDTGETEVNVVTDTDAIIENIESFIEKTNSIRDAIAALDEDTSSTSVSTSTDDDDDEDTSFDQVRGNYGMDIIEQTLQDILSSRGIGFELYDSESGTGDVYASLVSIGISTDADDDSETFGHLIIDYDELEEALAEDPDAVASSS